MENSNSLKSIFENLDLEHFGKDNKINLVFEMGESEDNFERVNSTLIKSKEILDFLFNKKNLWVKLIIWNKSFNTRQQLENCHFDWNKAKVVIELNDSVILKEFEKEDTESYCLFYPQYEFENIKPIIQAIAAFELGIYPAANITAYFISFDRYPFLVNLYDDRGMEVLFCDTQQYDTLKNEFSKYIII